MNITCKSELWSPYSALAKAKLSMQPVAGKRLRFARRDVEPGAVASYSNSYGYGSNRYLGYLDLAIAPKTGRGTPAGAQVKILWQGILASARRLLALLPAKMNANVNGRQRRLLQSVVARALPTQ